MADEIETIELRGGPGHGATVPWRGGDEMFMTNGARQNRVMRVVYNPPMRDAGDLRYVRSTEYPSVFDYKP